MCSHGYQKRMDPPCSTVALPSPPSTGLFQFRLQSTEPTKHSVVVPTPTGGMPDQPQAIALALMRQRNRGRVFASGAGTRSFHVCFTPRQSSGRLARVLWHRTGCTPSCIYYTYKLTKFIKILKNHKYYFLLLHLCIKFQY
jgi:hypothetical protein